MAEPKQSVEDVERDPGPRLRDAFLEEHRRFTRGLRATLAALRAGDDARAIEVAAELDAKIGAHIEFEEMYFYPELRSAYDSEFVDQLYSEHEEGRCAVSSLVACAPGGRLSPAERERIVAQLETALQHALSCGSLVSHLGKLEARKQAQLLERLQETRSKGSRWSERGA